MKDRVLALGRSHFSYVPPLQCYLLQLWNTYALKCLNKMQLFNRYFFGHSARHYHSLEELSEALLNREVDGILIDAYAGGTQKHLFSKPSVRVARVIDHQTAYGVVIGGDSMRLRHCFYGYMRSHQAEIFKWVEELVEPIKVRFKQGDFFGGGGGGAPAGEGGWGTSRK